MLKKCPNCGTKFETFKQNKKYCSKKCYEHVKYIRKKQRKKQQKEQLIKKCSYCGQEFKTTKKNQKYCSFKCYEYAKQDRGMSRNNNKRMPLGTIGKLPKYNGDFEKEQKIIKYLKKRAGLS